MKIVIFRSYCYYLKEKKIWINYKKKKSTTLHEKSAKKREREGSKHFPLGAMPTSSWLAYIKLNIQFGHALLLLVDYISTNMSNAERCSMLRLANPIAALDQCFGWENLFLLSPGTLQGWCPGSIAIAWGGPFTLWPADVPHGWASSGWPAPLPWCWGQEAGEGLLGSDLLPATEALELRDLQNREWDHWI